jgi:hypothetical protein
MTCGRLPSEPFEPQAWGHNIGSAGDVARCDRAATIWANVPHADRVCQSDADCVPIVANGNCFRDALNRSGAAKPLYRATPCGNPAAGACAGPRDGWKTRCYRGCCQVISW